MGHASSIGLGIALNTEKKVLVIDGDGSILMRMGSLAMIGENKLQNYIHIVIDNGTYESTGGQTAPSSSIVWEDLFTSFGYKTVKLYSSIEKLRKLRLNKLKGPTALVIKVKSGSRKDLGRPKETPIQNKKLFQKFLTNVQVK